MSEHTTRGRAQDRTKVAGGQKHEVRYESDKTGASKETVQQTVKDVGNSRRKVESDLKNKVNSTSALGRGLMLPMVSGCFIHTFDQ